MPTWIMEKVSGGAPGKGQSRELGHPRFALGHVDKDLLSPHFVLVELKKTELLADDEVGNEGRVGLVGGERDLQAIVDQLDVDDPRAGAEELRGAFVVRVTRSQADEPYRPSAGARPARSGQMRVPAFDDGDAVAERLQLAEDVGGDDDRLPHPLQFLEDGHHLDLSRARIEAAGGFVEEQELGVMDENASKAEALLHAPAERTDQGTPLLREPDQFQDIGQIGFVALGRRDAVAGTEEVEVLGDFHVLEDPKKSGMYPMM